MATAPTYPICVNTLGTRFIDGGTSCLWQAPAPQQSLSPPPSPQASGTTSGNYFYSPAVRTAVDLTFTVSPGMTWDGFWRLVYDRANAGFQQQANQLLKQGRVSAAEVAKLVDGRNELLLRIRSRLSPFGELYSELLKPRTSLKGFEHFLAEKGTIEAVLRSAGKTRAVVDRIAVVSRVAGPVSIVLEVTLTAVVIQQAAPQDRSRVAATEVGGVVGSLSFGLAGMWAGCASASLLASPSLVLPVVGEVTTGGACLVGGMLGGLGIGWLGREAGRSAGANVYDWTHQIDDFRWKPPG